MLIYLSEVYIAKYDHQGFVCMINLFDARKSDKEKGNIFYRSLVDYLRA